MSRSLRPLPSILSHGLRLPAVMAPMLLISNPEMVIAACRAGVVGSFPTLNIRTTAEYAAWLDRIEGALGPEDAIFAANLIVSQANKRLADDLAVTIAHKVPLVITSFGADETVVRAIHDYGGLVFHDVGSVRHVEKAAASGVDGLILLTAGAGGHTGWLNPFAFLNEARARYDGILLLAGALSTGGDIASAIMAGADLAYMGTRFIATQEAGVAESYQEMLVRGGAKDVLVTSAISGTAASFLLDSLRANGLDPDALDGYGANPLPDDPGTGPKPWRDIWSAGQGIGTIEDIPTIAGLVDRLDRQFDEATASFTRRSFR